MNHTVRIAVLDSLCQAQMLESVLKDQGIPHVIRSYHDLALDGLFQGMKGWGQVEAAEEYRETIVTAIEDLKAAGGQAEE